MFTKKVLALALILSAQFLQAQEARVTDASDLQHILGAHPVAQEGALAASLVAGRLDRIKAITVKQSKSIAGQGCDLTFTYESELSYGTRGEVNGMCLPESIFNRN